MQWCVVPQKEGRITPYMDIAEIAVDGRNRITLMDNNVLASNYGLEQIEKIIHLTDENVRKRASINFQMQVSESVLERKSFREGMVLIISVA